MLYFAVCYLVPVFEKYFGYSETNISDVIQLVMEGLKLTHARSREAS